MCDALNELCEEIFADKIKDVREEGREEGRESGIMLAKSVLKLSQLGTPIEEIACQCGISKEKVLDILE